LAVGADLSAPTHCKTHGVFSAVSLIWQGSENFRSSTS
jgi:hypothetical protein